MKRKTDDWNKLCAATLRTLPSFADEHCRWWNEEKADALFKAGNYTELSKMFRQLHDSLPENDHIVTHSLSALCALNTASSFLSPIPTESEEKISA
jgi:hypothetical protein